MLLADHHVHYFLGFRILETLKFVGGVYDPLQILEEASVLVGDTSLIVEVEDQLEGLLLPVYCAVYSFRFFLADPIHKVEVGGPKVEDYLEN